jgi:uncharacterized protein with HEPN domain
MSRDPFLFLDDILQSVLQVREFVDGMEREDFLQDRKTIHACMSCFQIVGEAAKKLPVEWKESEPGIPWGEIQGFRNALAHEYFHIDERIMWGTIQEDIEPLLLACQRIRDRIETDCGGDPEC